MAALDKLPAELVENIVLSLTLHEICAFRLANRSIASKASQDHFRSFYRSKRVDVDEHGLKDFVVVTANGGMGCLIDDFTLTGLVYNSFYIQSQLRSGNVREDNWRAITEEERAALQRQLNTFKRREQAQMHFLQSEDAQRLLVKAFRNIVKGRAANRPLSLTLDLAVYRDDPLIRSTPLEGGSWRMIWQNAADTFQLVQDALDRTMLPVYKLRLFPVYGQSGQKRSSLACNEIGPVIKYSGLESCLANLRSLTVTYSDKSILSDDRDAELVDAWDKAEMARQRHGYRGLLKQTLEAADPSNFTGLLSFVQACHNLEELELHRYRLTRGAGSTAHVQGDKMSHILFTRLTLPHLRDCRLRGFRASSDDTVNFLRRHRLHKLLLKNFALSAGSYRVIFDHCTGDGADIEPGQPDLNRIEFEDLFEERSDEFGVVRHNANRQWLVLFAGPDQEHDSDVGGKRGSNMIQRWSSGTKRPIQYTTQDSRDAPLQGNSTRFSEWQRAFSEEFGPPDFR
ncbi:hypothetical protein CKM354_000660500 [Cercospora kikuchii]|uniref:F-box domain-containing protein n=1 Tax=Cercospora kikuchii TaxID=84275 RepID=A0A9P3CPF2_9PEZI|nr:uncharacterized protein CKM354_000660500 [Cercospora kikuchii]GIZ43375.1 hypothetical protein CKM354_000660500 [Cercospora kikuchii]